MGILGHMNSIAPSTRTLILTAAYDLFYRQGFARVSMEMIAEKTGFTKRTLYYHFRSKDDLAAEALNEQNAIILDQMQKWKLGETNDVRELALRLFQKLEIWASQSNWTGSGFTRLTMELAHLPGHPARKTAGEHKKAIEELLLHELKNVGAQNPETIARHLLILIEGSVSMAFIHSDTSYISEAAKAAALCVGCKAE